MMAMPKIDWGIVKKNATEVLLWFVANGLSILGLKEVIYWIMRLLLVFDDNSQVPAAPWLYAMAIFTVFGFQVTLWGPIRKREAEAEFARKKALMVIWMKVGGEREMWPLLTDDLQPRRILVLTDQERRDVISDAGLLASTRRNH